MCKTNTQLKWVTPTDNGTMESINGWIKDELFNDFDIRNQENIFQFVKECIEYFNNERPSYALNYLTPKEFKMCLENEKNV